MDAETAWQWQRANNPKFDLSANSCSTRGFITNSTEFTVDWQANSGLSGWVGEGHEETETTGDWKIYLIEIETVFCSLTTLRLHLR